jgi:hypothetical protein
MTNFVAEKQKKEGQLRVAIDQWEATEEGRLKSIKIEKISTEEGRY